MRTQRTTLILRAIVGFVGAFGIVRSGVPCCGVSAAGKAVQFGGQTNIVIWDSARQVEHFVRRAEFQFKAADMGFIAPTPSRPDLAEVKEEVFQLLEGLEPRGFLWREESAAAAGGVKGRVEVVQEKVVAGYRATTLKASDAEALAKWMRKNHYATSPGIKAWTQKYIAKGWYLTTFKVLGNRDYASTGTVRMSFKTDRPFNPYYVPADNRPKNGEAQLRLYFLANGRYDGLIGGKKEWRKPDWETDVPADSRPKIESYLGLKAGELPRGLHLASYTDGSFAKAESDDLYFRPTSPPYALYGLAFAVVLLIGFGVSQRIQKSRS